VVSYSRSFRRGLGDAIPRNKARVLAYSSHERALKERVAGDMIAYASGMSPEVLRLKFFVMDSRDVRRRLAAGATAAAASVSGCSMAWAKPQTVATSLDAAL
jgi:hypothetical protein